MMHDASKYLRLNQLLTDHMTLKGFPVPVYPRQWITTYEDRQRKALTSLRYVLREPWEETTEASVRWQIGCLYWQNSQRCKRVRDEWDRRSRRGGHPSCEELAYPDLWTAQLRAAIARELRDAASIVLPAWTVSLKAWLGTLPKASVSSPPEGVARPVGQSELSNKESKAVVTQSKVVSARAAVDAAYRQLQAAHESYSQQGIVDYEGALVHLEVVRAHRERLVIKRRQLREARKEARGFSAPVRSSSNKVEFPPELVLRIRKPRRTRPAQWIVLADPSQ